MHIHLPKPLHGWREFIGEVGIIVIGVLIALGAEQLMEILHWRDETQVQRQALHEIIRDSLREAEARRLQDPCMQHRLDEIRKVLVRHARGEQLNIIGPVGAPDNLSVSLAVWNVAVNSQALDHMPLKEKLSLSSFFDAMQEYQTLKLDEVRTWDKLAALDFAPTLAPQDWSAVMQAYLEARSYASRMPAFTAWVLQPDFGETPPKLQLKDVQMREAARDLCRPLIRD